MASAQAKRVDAFLNAVRLRMLEAERLSDVPGDVRPADRRVLEALADGGALRMSALAGVVDKLVRLRLVKRTRPRDDRRVVEVGLQPRGEALVEGSRRVYLDVTRSLLEPLSAEERFEFARLAWKIAEAWRRDGR